MKVQRSQRVECKYSNTLKSQIHGMRVHSYYYSSVVVMTTADSKQRPIGTGTILDFLSFEYPAVKRILAQGVIIWQLVEGDTEDAIRKIWGKTHLGIDGSYARIPLNEQTSYSCILEYTVPLGEKGNRYFHTSISQSRGKSMKVRARHKAAFA